VRRAIGRPRRPEAPGETLRILFLGAAKRLSLFERFAAACREENTDLEILSYEDSHAVPVVALAKVIVGPRWDSPEFEPHLLSTLLEYSVRVVIPCMDAATVALSRAAPAVTATGCWSVVSSIEICSACENKVLAQRWFAEHDVRTPIWAPETPFPWMVKHVHGYGSRRQFLVHSKSEFDALKTRVPLEDYLVQPFVEGPEFTIDAYVSREGEVLGCVSRRRLEVAAGEVVRSVTERRPAILDEASRVLHTRGFLGPITLQAIEGAGGPWFIEINPRFGGGVILSIEAGADYPRFLIREALGRPVAPVEWREGVLMTRAFREVFHEESDRDNHR